LSICCCQDDFSSVIFSPEKMNTGLYLIKRKRPE
jgi:hypothetical protein